MKNLFYLYFISALSFASCDEAVSIVEEVVPPTDEVIPTPVPDDKNTPSDFDFTTLQASDTLYIAYSHDLGGKSIEVPSNVVINSNDGEIINGTLVFKEGEIDGKLLNHKLTVYGKPSLTSTTFKFEKSKWKITEGEVSDAIALVNKNTLENVIAKVKSYGGEIFQVDDLDAYFLISSEQNLINGRKDAISIPSDFSLEMTDNTHLRVQANRYLRYNLFNIMDVSNVEISGGNLYGDRDNHDYTPITLNGTTYTAFEWGHLIAIEAGVNIKITNVHLSDAVGDGLDIHSLGFAFESDYIPTNNITVSGCIFDNNRRNNLSITDGYNMLIENNTFLNAGADTQYSKGTGPGCGIDVEGYRQRDANGDLVLYQIAKDVIIRNNTERGSKASAILVAIGQDIIIENNTVEKNLGFSLANGVKIRNNTVTGKDIASSITGGSAKDSPTTYGNEISGNIVSSSRQGIVVYNQGVKVYDNKISDCNTGISIKNITDSEIYNNTITSRKTNCYGVFGHVSSINNVDIKNNDIDVSYKSIAFVNVNIEAGQLSNTVTVSANDLNGGKVSISNSNGIVVE